MDDENEKLGGLEPAFQTKVRDLLSRARADGMRVEVLRGRTEPGEAIPMREGRTSLHELGLAVDILHHQPSRDFDDAQLGQFGRLGESLGLVWGGSWEKPDPTHFQAPLETLANAKKASVADSPLSCGGACRPCRAS